MHVFCKINNAAAVTWWACLVLVMWLALRKKSAIPTLATPAWTRQSVQPLPSRLDCKAYMKTNKSLPRQAFLSHLNWISSAIIDLPKTYLLHLWPFIATLFIVNSQKGIAHGQLIISNAVVYLWKCFKNGTTFPLKSWFNCTYYNSMHVW